MNGYAGKKMKEELFKIHQSLQAFKFSDLQRFKTLISILEKKQITIEDFKKYMDIHDKIRKIHKDDPQRYRELINKSMEYITKDIKKCPDCGSTMRLNPGDDHDSHWVCPKCRFSMYDKKPYEEQIKDSGALDQIQFILSEISKE